MKRQTTETLALPARRRVIQQGVALGTATWVFHTVGADPIASSLPPAPNPWLAIPPLVLNAGESVSIAQYYGGTGVEFGATKELPAGVNLSASGILSVATNAQSATLTEIAFTAAEAVSGPSPVPTPGSAPAPTPAPAATLGSLQLLGQYKMVAATNDPGAATPHWGKHMSIAYRPAEKAVYLFGGDGTSWQGVGNNSHCWHFGKLLLPSTVGTTPVFQHFFPYLGIAGQPVPAGYDCVPFVYDKSRDVFWQMGGFQWGITSEGWIGTPEAGGVWKFTQSGVFGTWTHVTTNNVPSSGAEGMQAMYHALTDRIIGIREGIVWWYDCATGATGSEETS